MQDRSEKSLNVLLFTLDLTPTSYPTHRKPTGFSLAVDHIARILAKYGQVSMSVSCSAFSNKQTLVDESYCLLERNAKEVLKHIRIRDIVTSFRYFFSASKLPFKLRTRLCKWQLCTGLYAHQLRETKADTAFIHSLLPNIIPFVAASLRNHKPIVLVCHAAYKNIDHSFETNFAKQILNTLIGHGCILSCVGSGNQKFMREQNNPAFASRIFCIGNPIPPLGSINPAPRTKRFRIIVSGNMDRRKNQAQVVRALALLPPDLLKETDAWFIGDDRLDGQVQQEAKRLKLEDVCIFTGSVTREKTLELTASGSVVVSATVSEGFGLPFLEGYGFGIPAVFFSDIDAASELGDPGCAIMAKDRTDSALAQAISTALEREWDKKHIQSFAKQFSEEKIAHQYQELLTTASACTLTEKQYIRLIINYLKSF